MKNSKTKILFVLSIIFLHSQVYSQSDQEVLDTYWKYRDRLRKDFVKIGNAPGESIPAVSRRLGVGKNQTGYSATGPSSIKYSDATITIGQYLCILATEYKLLNDNKA